MKLEQTNEQLAGIASAAGAYVPTIALVLGVFLYHELFTGVHLASFICIWTALMVFSLARTRSFVQFESVILKKISVNDKERA